jgi:palmitoyltransferase
VKASSKPSISARSEGHICKALDYEAILQGKIKPPPGIGKFYFKDHFICDSRGFPIWCTICSCWKPDRTHHCSEIDRCVRRMDHFCPWVGGIVSETNMKFFIQFACYGLLYNAFVVAVTAFTLQKKRNDSGNIDVNLAVIAALAGLFLLMSFGVAFEGIRLSCHNLTTIENLSKDMRVYHIAVYVKDFDTGQLDSVYTGRNSGTGTTLREHLASYPSITYPFVDHQGTSADSNLQTGPYKEKLPSNTESGPRHPRTYLILETKMGENPWELSPLENIKSVMGSKWSDWILPLKYSPHCKHHKHEDEFPFGPVLTRLKQEAGLIAGDENARDSGHSAVKFSRHHGSRKPG